ncbi:hypothetical protein BGX30_002691 [Mortierella sp. GBA39]|nr:hypothetical protein BGX30_002691 [Mortierella sp. GBA39]
MFEAATQTHQVLRVLHTTRYLEPRNRVPFSTDWRLRLLEAYDNKDFAMFMSMTKAQFNTLVDLMIKDQPVFISRGNKPQLPVREQLKICLYKLGATAMGFDYVKAQHGVSKGQAFVSFW